MEYLPDDRLPDHMRPRAVGCDGLCEVALQLSHWKGNRTPARYKADLSTQMALAFARSEERARFEVATNNHYDADGALSLFACIDPERALPQRDLLVKAAAFGDFQHGSDEDALKLAAILEGLPAARGLDDAAATERALAMLPTLGAELAKHEALWAEELAWFRASRDALRSGAVTLTELDPAGLTVVEAREEPHPAVVDGAARGDLYLYALDTGEGYRYRADWTYYSWAETVSPQRPPVRTVDLEKLCLPLNSLEPTKAGTWTARGQGMTEALRFAAPDGTLAESKLGPREAVERLAWFLVERRAVRPK